MFPSCQDLEITIASHHVNLTTKQLILFNMTVFNGYHSISWMQCASASFSFLKYTKHPYSDQIQFEVRYYYTGQQLVLILMLPGCGDVKHEIAACLFFCFKGHYGTIQPIHKMSLDAGSCTMICQTCKVGHLLGGISRIIM